MLHAGKVLSYLVDDNGIGQAEILAKNKRGGSTRQARVDDT